MDFTACINQVAGNSMLLRVVIAVVLIIVLAALIHLAVKALKRFMRKREGLPEVTFFVNLLRASLWVVGGAIILDACFDVNITALLAALGIGGIAVSLGLQDTLKNLFGGAQVIGIGLVKPGDYIRVGEYAGVVQDVTWRQTTIKNRKEEQIIIPNSIMASSEIVQLVSSRRPTVNFVATDYANLDELKANLEAAAHKALEGFTIVDEPTVYFEGFEGMGMNGRILFTIGPDEDVNLAVSEVTRAVAPMVRSEAAN